MEEAEKNTVMRYAFDGIIVTVLAGHSRIEATGWVISRDGTAPKITLAVNGKAVETETIYQTRDDVISALKQDTEFGLNTETADHNCGFRLAADGLPEKLKEICFCTDKNEVLKRMDEREISNSTVHHLIHGTIDLLSYNPGVQSYSVLGWAYSRDGLPAQFRTGRRSKLPLAKYYEHVGPYIC